jgi:hypothetical protein
MIPEAHPAIIPVSKKSSGEQKLLTLIDFLSLREQVRNEYPPEKSCDRWEWVVEGMKTTEPPELQTQTSCKRGYG